MTPDQKPEWFQIAEADSETAPRKISKGLPVIALVAVAAILGVGAVMAQTQEQSPANATETVATAPIDSTQPATTSALSESVAPSTNEVPAPRIKNAPTPTDDAPVITSASQETTATTATPVAPKAPGIANPLGKKPKGGDQIRSLLLFGNTCQC